MRGHLHAGLSLLKGSSPVGGIPLVLDYLCRPFTIRVGFYYAKDELFKLNKYFIFNIKPTCPFLSILEYLFYLYGFPKSNFLDLRSSIIIILIRERDQKLQFPFNLPMGDFDTG